MKKKNKIFFLFDYFITGSGKPPIPGRSGPIGGASIVPGSIVCSSTRSILTEPASSI